MRSLVALFVVIGCLACESAAMQSAPRGGGAKPAISACSMLTREIVMQVSPYEKQALDLVLRIPPQEDAVGSGSACSYGGITMQVDPFAPAVFERQIPKEMAPLAGLGDVAHFGDLRKQWAQLYVRAGAHVLTVQMAIPDGRTAASIQSNVVALAKAILPKLK